MTADTSGVSSLPPLATTSRHISFSHSRLRDRDTALHVLMGCRRESRSVVFLGDVDFPAVGRKMYVSCVTAVHPHPCPSKTLATLLYTKDVGWPCCFCHNSRDHSDHPPTHHHTPKKQGWGNYGVIFSIQHVYSLVYTCLLLRPHPRQSYGREAGSVCLKCKCHGYLSFLLRLYKWRLTTVVMC